MILSRRDFLKKFASMTGCFAASASNISCSKSHTLIHQGENQRYHFPQGIASSDPQPDAILLWTRITDKTSDKPVNTIMQLSRDQDFNYILAEKAMTADSNSDFTLRCFVDGLDSNQWYYYRFLTDDSHASRTGRTRTAPANDADETLNLIMFSCQNYERGYFNAYRRMIIDDEGAKPEDRIDLCIHVGDFIYENVNGSAFSATGESALLKNRDGSDRTAGKLPSGGKPRGRGNQLLPKTLDDYRHIYKSYLSDPSIQAARAWYPFVYIWDDHEVLNDYWQAYSPGGSIQTLKVVGNQAWFEYLPAILSDADPGPLGYNPARDFEPVEVKDTNPGVFDEDYLSLEPNTQAAIASMTIYRALKWGTLADIILVDGRSYRGPRGLDSSILGSDMIAYPKAPIDPKLIRIMNAGKTANNGNPPATLEYEGESIPNPRRQSPRASLLGNRQKNWLKDTLTASNANWKLLCNNVPMMRFGFDTRFLKHGTRSSIYWTDSWDGYPIERNEIMDFLKESKQTNIVSMTGDRHAHFAGMVLDDYENKEPVAVIPELVGSGISADDRFRIQMRLFKDVELLKRTGFDGKKINYYTKDAPALNAWMLYGEQAAAMLSKTADTERAMSVADPSINSHLVYADTDAYGYYSVRVRKDRIYTEFVTIPIPLEDESSNTPKVRRRVRMEIPAWQPGTAPEINNISFDGEETILGIKSNT